MIGEKVRGVGYAGRPDTGFRSLWASLAILTLWASFSGRGGEGERQKVPKLGKTGNVNKVLKFCEIFWKHLTFWKFRPWHPWWGDCGKKYLHCADGVFQTFFCERLVSRKFETAYGSGLYQSSHSAGCLPQMFLKGQVLQLSQFKQNVYKIRTACNNSVDIL